MRGTGKATDLQEGLEGCHRRQSGQEGLRGRVTVQRYPLDHTRLSKQRRRVSPAALLCMYVIVHTMYLNCPFFEQKLSSLTASLIKHEFTS